MEVNNIVRKYSDSYEYQRDKLRASINTKFQNNDGFSPYDFKAHYPNDNVVVVLDWNKNEYFEIPYTLEENGDITLGDPQSTEHDETFTTKEQIVNSMKNKEPIILVNAIENPTYRVLVQTDEELPGWDKGLDKIKYNGDGIKKAMPSLLGKEVMDDSNSNHARLRGEKTKNRFGKVVNEGYCPDYGGYVDLEVHDPNYVGLMNSMIDSINRDLPVDLGFSTEIANGYESQEYGDNSLEVVDWSYNGLVLTDRPRDKKATVCNVINNSIPKKEEDDSLTDEIVNINKNEYDELVQAKSELDELKPQHEQLKTDYADGEKLYNDVKTDRDDMHNQLVPIWTEQGEKKEAMVNSLLETVPEAEKDGKRKELEDKDFGTLEFLVNSLPGSGSGSAGTGSRGIGEGSGGTPPSDKGDKLSPLEERTAAALERRTNKRGIVKR